VIKRRSPFFFKCEVVEVAVSSELVSSIVGIVTPIEGLVIHRVLVRTCKG